MTSEGLGEMFEGDSADTCTGKFPLVSMGGRADRQACADGERGPPSARAEILCNTNHPNAFLWLIKAKNILSVMIFLFSRAFGLQRFMQK